LKHHFSRDKFINIFIPNLPISRIVQELLSNTLRHSGASKVDVSITGMNNYFRLSYQDNGVGFKPNTHGRTGGLGLKNIESRVKVMGGEFIIHEVGDVGFFVTIEIQRAVRL
jgi:signal transduction histidine kinase